MSGSRFRNRLTNLYREARQNMRNLKKNNHPAEFILWEETAEKTFSRCVIRHRGGIISSSDFQIAMDLCCMNLDGFLPPVLPMHPLFEDDFFLLLFRRHGYEPVISFLPGYQHIWSGVMLNIPQKWFLTDRSRLKTAAVEWRISECTENVPAVYPNVPHTP